MRTQLSPVVQRNRLPKQDTEKVVILANRWERAAGPHRIWAEAAKECVNFLEGRQWTAEQIADLEKQGRPVLTLNKIMPLVRLVLGFHRNNRQDFKYPPSGDGLSAQNVSEVLEAVAKHASDETDLEYVDTEAFLDGLVTGRGFYEDLIDFEDNILGEIKTRALDPFSVYLDPDGHTYDLNESCNYIQTTRWVSLDEIEDNFGPVVAEVMSPFFSGNAWTAFPQFSAGVDEEVTPIRSFGLDDDISEPQHAHFREIFEDQFIDPYRKNIRLLNSQYYLRSRERVFIDLETGQMEMIPRDWDEERIRKVLFHAEQIGNPMMVDVRPWKRVRWTTIVGDVIVFDEWSPYKTFSITGYFPYFRRGATRGMVDDLKDPQREINKRRSAEIEIVGRVANSGWIHDEGALTPDQEKQLDLFGARPGIRIKKKPNTTVERIDPLPPPTAMERLEDRASDDIREISGVNESATGDLDRVQSGRAVEARQRQAVIGFQMYTDNFSRTKKLQGRRYLNLIQKFYTEERVFRVLGEDGKRSLTHINQRSVDPISGQGRVLNDVTAGTYLVSVDETPMSATFLNAQFEEVLLILEKLGPVGQAIAQARPDLLIEMSSLPRKDEWAAAFQQVLGTLPPGPAGGPPGGGGVVPGEAATQGTALTEAAGAGGNVVPIDPRTGGRTG